MARQKHIFRRGPVSVGGVAVFLFLGLVLILINTFTNLLTPARSFFVDIIAPFYRITDVTTVVTDWSDDNFRSREALLEDVARLEDENLILQRRVMTMVSLQAENARLKQLLSASEIVSEKVMIAGLVGTPPDTETHRLLINRGRLDGVEIGQPVVDADGLFGQVIVAGDETSELVLITDREHAMPVEVLRNGARAIAEGTGDYSELRLRNIPPTMDIRVGDKIVSSGLGQRFPRGYPAGEVVSIVHNNSSPFMDVRVLPSAGLQTSRQLLLLFSSSESISPRVTEPPVED